MLKSTQYKIAQMCVLNSHDVLQHEKLEILRTLMGDESTARFVEEREEKEAEKNGNQ